MTTLDTIQMLLSWNGKTRAQLAESLGMSRIAVQKVVIYEDNRIVIYFNLDNENAPSTIEGAYKQLVVNRSSEHTKRIYSMKGLLLRMEIVGSGEYRAVYKGRVTYPRIR